MGKTLVRASRRKYKKSAKGGKRTKRGRRVMKKSGRTKRRHMRMHSHSRSHKRYTRTRRHMRGGWLWESSKDKLLISFKSAILSDTTEQSYNVFAASPDKFHARDGTRHLNKIMQDMIDGALKRIMTAKIENKESSLFDFVYEKIYSEPGMIKKLKTLIVEQSKNRYLYYEYVLDALLIRIVIYEEIMPDNRGIQDLKSLEICNIVTKVLNDDREKLQFLYRALLLLNADTEVLDRFFQCLLENPPPAEKNEREQWVVNLKKEYTKYIPRDMAKSHGPVRSYHRPGLSEETMTRIENEERERRAIDEEAKKEGRARNRKEAGFTASDLKKAGFTASQLKIEGFTASDLKKAGFTESELEAAGFTDSDEDTRRYGE
jgi:hypothetical protein